MERDKAIINSSCNLIISTHALTWSATGLCLVVVMSGLHFNSRAHVERDIIKVFDFQQVHISTHALTWSATDNVVSVTICQLISTHALTWSATLVD